MTNTTVRQAVQGGPRTMTVRVRDRTAETPWGSGPTNPIVVTVTIPAICPKCGGPRGEPKPLQQHDDGVSYTTDVWQNPCEHLDRYEDVVREAAAPVVTFHDEPAIISRVDEYGRREEVMDRSASYTCAMLHDPEHEGELGWCERENVETSRIWMEWQPFYAVQLPGETEPQRFCEDDARWITIAAEYLLADDSA